MKKLSLLLAVIIFTGCAHVPEKQAAPVRRELSATAVAETIVKGKTTSAEVLAAFGTPNSIARNTRRPSKEALAKITRPLDLVERTATYWNYWTVPSTQEFSRAMSTTGVTNIFRLTVYFDDNNVVVDYEASDRTVDLAR